MTTLKAASHVVTVLAVARYFAPGGGWRPLHRRLADSGKAYCITAAIARMNRFRCVIPARPSTSKLESAAAGLRLRKASSFHDPILSRDGPRSGRTSLATIGLSP